MKDRLIGIVDEQVEMKRFQLGAQDFSNGGQLFNGNIVYPLTGGVDVSGERSVAGFGCGVYTFANACLQFHLDTDAILEKTIDVARKLGVTYETGVWDEHMEGLAKHFGMLIRPFFLDTPEDLRRPLENGWLAMMSSWEMCEDELRDGSQRGDGHWILGISMDMHGSLLVLDSSRRTIGRDTFGLVIYTSRAVDRIGYECDGRLNAAENKVFPGAFWWRLSGFFIKPDERKSLLEI